MGFSDSTLECPKCASDKVSVIDSRQNNGHRLRRRKCGSCKHRWSTIEVSVTMFKFIERLESTIIELQNIQRMVTKTNPSVNNNDNIRKPSNGNYYPDK